MGNGDSPTRISRWLDLTVTAWFGARLLPRGGLEKVVVIGCDSRALVQYYQGYNQVNDNKTAQSCNSSVCNGITIL